MFEEFCPAHQSRVLLSTGRIEALRNTTEGVVVVWRCWCGHRGESVRRQQRQGQQVPPAHVPAPAAVPAEHKVAAPVPTAAATAIATAAHLRQAC